MSENPIEIETVAVKIEIREHTADDLPIKVGEPGFYFWYEWPTPAEENMLFGPLATHDEAEQAAHDYLAEVFGDSAVQQLTEAVFVEEDV
jgi:hypothetical protein